MWQRHGLRLDDLGDEANYLLDAVLDDASSHLSAALMGWPAPLGPWMALRTAQAVHALAGVELDISPREPRPRRDPAEVAEADEWLSTRTAIPN